MTRRRVFIIELPMTFMFFFSFWLPPTRSSGARLRPHGDDLRVLLVVFPHFAFAPARVVC